MQHMNIHTFKSPPVTLKKGHLKCGCLGLPHSNAKGFVKPSGFTTSTTWTQFSHGSLMNVFSKWSASPHPHPACSSTQTKKYPSGMRWGSLMALLHVLRVSIMFLLRLRCAFDLFECAICCSSQLSPFSFGTSRAPVERAARALSGRPAQLSGPTL